MSTPRGVSTGWGLKGHLPLVLFGLLAGGCGGSGDIPPSSAPEAGDPAAAPAIVRHLLRDFPAAELRHEVASIELGTPEARPHLAGGWGSDEHDGQRPFAWGLGEGSELELFVSSPRDLTLVLECRGPSFGEGPSQAVKVVGNGEELGTVELDGQFRRHRLAVPAAVLRSGTNRLRFEYRFHRAPRDVVPGSDDPRPLAVQWASIGLLDLENQGPPRLAEDGDRLEIPAGARVSYYFELEPGWQLVFGELDRWGRGRSGLEIEVETAAGVRRSAFEAGGSGATVRLPLEVEAPAIGRLSLTAVPGPRGGWRDTVRSWLGRPPPAGGVSLLLPMVMGPAEDGEPAADGIPESATAGNGRPPDVVIYLIDTLRADHLGVYGYDRPTSPAIDRFARDGIVFRNAQAQSSWTRSSVVSLLTGLLPQVHGVNRRDDALNRRITTLAEHLGEAGYESAGFVTNGNVTRAFGLHRGFDRYDYLAESKDRFEFHVLADALNRQIFPWLEQRAGDRERPPFFLYAHSTDPHAPYTPPEPYRRRFAAEVDPALGAIDIVHRVSSGQQEAPPGLADDYRDLYDGEIAFNDHHFGRFLDRLKTLGLYESSLIVLLSDHGEEFLEHGGWEHGKTLYGEQLRVPLIVKLPGGDLAGTTVDRVADQVDVLPTVLELAGLAVPGGLDGRSLLPLARGTRRERPSFSYLRLEKKHLRSIAGQGYKLILDESEFLRHNAVELYDFTGDPLDARDLLPSRRLERGLLHQALRAFELDLRRGSRRSTADQAEIDAELRERLEALGYIQR